MYNFKKKTSFAVVVLAVILVFGSVAAYADSTLSPVSPVSPPAPDGWTWDDGDLVTPELFPREHIMRLVIGQYSYTQNGMRQVSDAPPFIQGSSTMVPLRLIAEAMGAHVAWDGITRTVTMTRGATVATLVIGQPVPGGVGTPTISNSRTFVPLRFVAEALGADVKWDGATQSIEVVWVWQPLAIGGDSR